MVFGQAHHRAAPGNGPPDPVRILGKEFLFQEWGQPGTTFFLWGNTPRAPGGNTQSAPERMGWGLAHFLDQTVCVLAARSAHCQTPGTSAVEGCTPVCPLVPLLPTNCN